MHFAVLGLGLGGEAEARLGLRPPPETSAAARRPTSGPCLKPWPDPPPTSTTLGIAGWRSIRKSPFELFSYWQTRRSVSGAPFSSGKRRSRKAMTSSSAARVGSRDWVSGSTATPCLSWANLTPRGLEVGKAVIHVAVVEVGPAGHGVGQEAAVALGRGEVEDLLPGGEDAAAEQVREIAWAAMGPARKRRRRLRMSTRCRAEPTSADRCAGGAWASSCR